MLVVCPSCGRHAFDHETACPHCGQRGKPTLAALTVALGFVATACSGPTDVYGPPPIDAKARTSAVSTNTNTHDTVVAVYGPPPVDPSTRINPSAIPSTAPSAAPSAAAPAPKVVDPPADVYGPPPRDPNQRK